MNNSHSDFTVLVVEDDANVREIAIQMFELDGFEVLHAIDAKSGLQVFNDNPQIDLVFSDLILPGGVTGIELTKQIIDQAPDTLIILATGYQDKGEAISATAQAMENIAYVPKPYDIDEVPKMVRSMIAAKNKQAIS